MDRWRAACTVSMFALGVGGCAAPQVVCPPPAEPAALKPGAVAMSKPAVAQLTLETDDEKTFYVVGQMVGANLGVFSLTPRELEIVQLGMVDNLLRRPQRVDVERYKSQTSTLAGARIKVRAAEEEVQGKAYRDQAARQLGATSLPSGVIKRTEIAGTGSSPGPNDRVTVHYEGKLVDGTVFDDSRKRGEPSTFPLSGVIKCWTEAVTLMKVGEKAILVCPPDTAYGDKGRPPEVPGGATLVFEIELLGVSR